VGRGVTLNNYIYAIDSIGAGGIVSVLSGGEGITRATPGIFTEDIEAVNPEEDGGFAFQTIGATLAVIDAVSLKRVL
jgi:hypothetical protein